MFLATRATLTVLTLNCSVQQLERRLVQEDVWEEEVVLVELANATKVISVKIVLNNQVSE